MKRIILAVLLVASPAAAQTGTMRSPSSPQHPNQPPAPPDLSQPQNQSTYNPQSAVTRYGNFEQYPDGSTGIVNPNGLIYRSDGTVCRMKGTARFCF